LWVVVRRDLVKGTIIEDEQQKAKICLKILGGDKDRYGDQDDFTSQRGEFPKKERLK